MSGGPAPLWCGWCGESLVGVDHDGCTRRAEHEPPRWCGRCRRRMVVQVLPRGWTACCAEHGGATG